jgi:hypothetical protein
MALKLSTGLVNALAATGSLKSVLETGGGFFIDIFSGSSPTDPNQPPGGTLLVTISLNGGASGLVFDATATDGTLNKPVAAVWNGTIAATGTASFYRLRRSTDTSASSTTEVRIDGLVGTSGADMNLTSTALVSGAPFSLAQFDLTIPRLV